MKNKILTLLAASVAISALAFGAYASEIKEPKSPQLHKIKGKLSLGYGAFSNIGITGNSINSSTSSEEEDEDDVEYSDDEDEIDLDDLVDEDLFDDSELLDTTPTVDAGNKLNTKTGVDYSYMFNQDRKDTWNVGLDFATDNFSNRGDLAKKSFVVSAGPGFNVTKQLKISPTVTYLDLFKNSKHLVNSVIGSLAAKYKYTDALVFSASYAHEDRDMTARKSPDAKVDTFTVGTEYKLTKEDKIKFAISEKLEDSDKAIKNKDKLGFKAGYERKLPFDLTAATVFGYNSSDFYNTATDREDDKYQFGISLTKEIQKDFDVSLGYERSRKDSSVAGKNSNNEGVMLVLTKKF